MHLVLLPGPTRTLVIVSDDHCLLFRSITASTSKTTTDSAAIDVEFLPISTIDFSSSIILSSIQGCLGLFNSGSDTYLAVITKSLSINSDSGGGMEAVSRVLAVEFYSCITSSDTTNLDNLDLATDFMSSNIGRVAGMSSDPNLLHPCAGIRQILNNGSFYYSNGRSGFDITRRLESRLTIASEKIGEVEEDEESGRELIGQYGEIDARFLWNSFLIAPLLRFRTSLTITEQSSFDEGGFVALVIQGYVGVMEINLGNEKASLSLFSRLNWSNYGTRFNSRGINDDGDVANFVETETIIRTSTLCCSFVQIRGSVPLFWEEGAAPFGKITISRPLEASLPSFLRHFQSILQEYSPPTTSDTTIQIINLLSTKEEEFLLTQSYLAHLRAAQLVDQDIREKVDITQFDFHSKSKAQGIDSLKTSLQIAVRNISEKFGSCLVAVDERGNGTILLNQRGIFRTNCKDCLDRTNVVEEFLSRFALEEFLRNSGGNAANFSNSHRHLFAENGDSLSRCYVGTNAINSSYTRSGKTTFKGMFSDVSKSVGRMYQSNFVDTGKQLAIDSLLGHLSSSKKVRLFNPINDAVRLSLKEQMNSYCTYDPISIYVASWNVNGKSPSNESLLPWLFSTPSLEPQIMVIGFQEIVPLNVQNIVATDPEKLKRWETTILKAIAERPGDAEKVDYVLLRSGQLVGTALIVLVNTLLVKDIKNVQVATKKTGLSGMAGNKGAIAIRLDYKSTSICFVTAHLAAGHSNVAERNADYRTIATGLKFPRGKVLADHDAIIWAADTNYRIDLENGTARELAENDDLATLADNDQLIKAMKAGLSFSGYEEGPLLFRPTYKYDNGTDVYDSSEKQRIPAWTDRILYSGTCLDLNRYTRAELFTSDHRPIYSFFTASIKEINYQKKSLLKKRLLADILAGGGEIHLVVKDEESEEDLQWRKVSKNHEGRDDLPLPSGEGGSDWWEGAPIIESSVRSTENPFNSVSSAPAIPPRPLPQLL